MGREVLAVASLATVLIGIAPVVPIATAQNSSQSAKCGVFYDKWEVPGAPATILAMAGLGHEVLAANDCIAQNNPEAACEHFRKVESALAKINASFADDMNAELQERMQRLGCH